MVICAGFLGFYYYRWLDAFEVHVHEIGIDEFFDDLFVFGEKDLHDVGLLLLLLTERGWADADFGASVDGTLPELFHQILIGDEHLGLVKEKDYLDQNIINGSEGYLLEIFTGYRVDG